MHVVFVEPVFPQNQMKFVHALAGVGARVTGIGERPLEAFPEALRQAMYGYVQVSSVVNEPEVLDAVKRLQAQEWVDRLEATVEAHIMCAARVRKETGIPGTTVETAYLCRDKPAMKQAISDAGLPCAQSAGVSSPEEARDFAQRVGYPIIFKPRGGAGAADTERIDDDGQLEDAIRRHGLEQGRSVAAEEFIAGHEGFYDTLSINGQVVHDFACHYYPGVLEAMRERHVSPYFITTNRLDDPTYGDVKTLGRKAIEALGIGTSATHMEWFFGPKGLKFSEIGCRPPGVGGWDLYCAANDFDLYREWAMAVVHGKSEKAPSRAYSAALLALRPDRDGQIVGYEGIERMQSQYGDCVVDSHFPPVGSSTSSVEAGYMANAWVRLRHPDYDTLRGIVEDVGRTVKVRAR